MYISLTKYTEQFPITFHPTIITGNLAFVNFSLNKVYTFPSNHRRTHLQARTFVVIALIGLLLTNLFALLFVYLNGNILNITSKLTLFKMHYPNNITFKLLISNINILGIIKILLY